MERKDKVTKKQVKGTRGFVDHGVISKNKRLAATRDPRKQIHTAEPAVK